jgi:membrane-bound lytic murein transglycosylase D
MRTLFLLFAFFSSVFSYAQVSLWDQLREKMKADEKNENVEDSIQTTLDRDSTLTLNQDSIVVSEAMDSISNIISDSTNTMIENQADYQSGGFTSDSVYIQRLSQLQNTIGLPYNETVRRCIELYVDRRRDLVQNMLGAESFYFPIIEEALNKYGLPQELKYLAVIESALNPVALSRAGALGLWQFMFSTGRLYGLEMNNLFDDRRDPVKSTDAACRYLKNLYDMFGDWNLAIAAYNCGEGNVNRAISRAGGDTDYWSIYPYLPKETRTYVPLFIAANYVMNYYADHQITPAESSLPLATDTVTVNQLMHFDQISDILHIDKETLRALNPQYKRDIIPGNYQTQTLTLPAEQVSEFTDKENEIAGYRADEFFANGVNIRQSVESRRERIIHRVTRGETVASIASRYGISARSIRIWNGLRSDRIPVGRQLILHVRRSRGYRSSGTRLRATAKQSPSEYHKTKNSKPLASMSHYKVRPGDTLYSIAQRFPGYSHLDLMKLNNMNHSSLKVGQYILVPKI